MAFEMRRCTSTAQPRPGRRGLAPRRLIRAAAGLGSPLFLERFQLPGAGTALGSERNGAEEEEQK